MTELDKQYGEVVWLGINSTNPEQRRLHEARRAPGL